MIRRRARTSFLSRAAAIAALTLALGVPAAAATAAPTAIDPGCDDYALGGFIEVKDPAETVPGLPPQVTTADMSCILGISGQDIYVYLTDPFVTFLAKTNSFVADGWTVTEFAGDDDTEIPVDVPLLAGRQDDPEIALHFMRGLDQALIFYSPDGIDATYGPGTIIVAYPLIGGAGGADLDDPSTISDLRTIGDAVPNAPQAGILIISASLLTLLLAIPAFLLSRVLASRYGQWFGWLERGPIGDLRGQLAKASGQRRWLFLGIGMALAALIAGFIDPRFGFNGLSVRLFLTLLATFVLFNVGAWAVVRLVLSRVQSDARPTLTFHPATLLVVAVAVLLSRLLDFDPGLVFGLVAGTTFAVALARTKEAIVILTGAAYAGVVALIAWVLYSLLNASGPPDNGFLVAISELLGGITIEGVSTLPIALIPLATLDGAVLFAWRRWVWAVAYAVGLGLFMFVLFTLPGGDQPADGDFVRWVIVFVVFAVLATGVWVVDYLLLRRTPTPTSA